MKRITNTHLYFLCMILAIPWIFTIVLITRNPYEWYGIAFNIASVSVIPLATVLILSYFENSPNPKRYITELAIVALLSEIPFNLLATRTPFPTLHTPFIALVFILITQYIINHTTRDIVTQSTANFITVISLFIITAITMLINIYQAPLVAIASVAYLLTKTRKQYFEMAMIVLTTLFVVILYAQSQIFNLAYICALAGLIPIHFCDKYDDTLPLENKHPKIRYLYKSYIVILLIITSIIFMLV